MSIIEDLWHGNIAPNERFFEKDSEYAAALHEVLQHSKDLRDRLNDEDAEILEKLTECTNEMCGIGERGAFVRGFTLGARIIMEVLNAESAN